MKRLNIGCCLIVFLFLCGNLNAQKDLNKAIVDLTKLDLDSVTFFKELTATPQRELNLFLKTLPAKRKKPLIEKKNLFRTADAKYPRVFQFAAAYKEYWFFTYTIHYGRYSEGVTAVMHVVKDELDFIIFLGMNFQPEELPKIAKHLDDNENKIKRIGLRKYKDKGYAY